MGRKASVFVRELTAVEKQKITSIKRKRIIHCSLRQSVDIVLLSSEGWEVKLIAHRVGLDQSNVNTWIKGFNKGGIDALGDIPKPGKGKEITKDIKLKIATIALSDPKQLRKPFTSWTVETIRQEAINSGVIATTSWEATRKALKNCGITTQRSCTWKESKDPDYESKKKHHRALHESA
ncbi:Winged helix-turn helix [Geosporobacter subterraneus DSM 17957]|uniref:Winged helix-turn helix n=1 Tax=Geosporobacter subterraneus DSM 17957 TaxID=1121919 RepID=A0A1M6EKP9_9FIRM|nr:helix-turn-helix domain-containing protein [Geosporobacter subterraneus]SHI86033.1 Winged helix-turn helix [Geosporobacter subterraneus DSM 17957]